MWFHNGGGRFDFAVAEDMAAMSGYRPITGPSLDPNKYWYVLTKSLCGSRPKDFAKNEIFRKFPDEIVLAETRELKPATKNCSFSKIPRNLYVATSFGLCAALLRQREFSPNGFIGSAKFTPVQDAMNFVILDIDDSETSLGGKSSIFGARDTSLQLEEMKK